MHMYDDFNQLYLSEYMFNESNWTNFIQYIV
jgi:hypothetical protein